MSEERLLNDPQILIIGASGTVGQALQPELSTLGPVTGTGWKRSSAKSLDIRDHDQVARLFEATDPQIVVLCSAISNVAACERDPEGSAAVNVQGTRNIARHCEHRKLVFFSSDAVFSDRKALWSETDLPEPPSSYGQQKAEAEEIVASCSDHLILRTARLYSELGGDGKFVDFVLRTLLEGNEVHAPLETPGNPTLVSDLCRATKTLISADERGTWHLAGPPIASLYETAQQIAAAFDLDTSRVHAVARDHGSDLPRISACLDTTKARSAGLEFCDLEMGLERRRVAQAH